MRRKHLDQTLNEKIEGYQNNMNTIAIAKITKIDNSKMMCSIKLLDMPEVLGTRDEVEEIDNVPIKPLFWSGSVQSNAPISVGDKVIVGFCQHGTFNARNSEEVTEPEHFSRFDLNNAMIIGFLTNDSTNSKFPNDFYIVYGSNIIRMNSSEIELKAPTINLNGNVNVSGNVVTQGTTTTSGSKVIDGHTHDNPEGGKVGIF